MNLYMCKYLIHNPAVGDNESHLVRLSAFHKKMVKPELLGEVIIRLDEVTELAISLYGSLPLKIYNLQLFEIAK